MSSVRVSDRSIYDGFTVIDLIYAEVCCESGSVRDDAADLGMLPLREDCVAARIVDAPHDAIKGFARVPASSTETHLHYPRPHLVGWGFDRGGPGPLDLRLRHHIIARERLT
jgi:hypothetical protein